MSHLDQQGAFDLLVAVVADFYESGRRAYSAGLKPELRVRSGGAFDEHALGYETFRGFISAAETAGLVDVHPALRGPDIEVVPTGRPSRVVDGGGSAAPASRRVRHDLWKAWLDWAPGYRRLYDRDADLAVRVASLPVAALSDEHRALVEAADAADGRVIEIAGISIEDQLGWMTEFAQTAGPRGARLMAALQRERPAQEFTNALRGWPDLAASWRDQLLKRVRAEIERWAAEHDLEIQLTEPPPPAPVVERQDHAADQTHERADAPDLDPETIRRLVRRAVERMPAEALLELSIPFKYFLEPRS